MHTPSHSSGLGAYTQTLIQWLQFSLRALFAFCVKMPCTPKWLSDCSQYTHVYSKTPLSGHRSKTREMLSFDPRGLTLSLGCCCPLGHTVQWKVREPWGIGSTSLRDISFIQFGRTFQFSSKALFWSTCYVQTQGYKYSNHLTFLYVLPLCVFN